MGVAMEKVRMIDWMQIHFTLTPTHSLARRVNENGKCSDGIGEGDEKSRLWRVNEARQTRLGQLE